MINAMLKDDMYLFFLGNKPKIGNEKIDIVELNDWLRKDSSNKADLNVLKAENVR